MTKDLARYPDLGSVLGVLAGAGFDVDPLDLADACWLAAALPAPPEAVLATATAGAPAPNTPPLEQPPHTASPAPGVARRGTGGNGSRYHARRRVAGGGPLVLLPDAPALPDKLALGRALRPLRRRVASTTLTEIDLIATANLTAVRRLAWDAAPLEPVLRPARTRWLDAVLLVDRSQTMAVWRRTLEEWTQLLHHLGAFRDLRVWHLVGGAGGLALVSPCDDPAHPGALREVAELADPSGRRLVLIASDCIGPLWSTTAMVRFLEALATAGPLAILQILPPHMWRRTTLARSSAFALSASAPGLRPRKLNAVALDLDAPRDSTAKRPLAIPVVPLRVDALAAWARLVLGMRNGRAAGYQFTSTAAGTAGHAVVDEPLDAATLVRRFIDASGAIARRLAVHLAAVPLTEPVMRLVRQEIVPEAREEHLVEVLFSGLVAQRIPDLWTAAVGEELFDFHPGVRELLLEGMTDTKIEAIARAIGAYLERTQGAAYNFAAMLDIPGEQGDATSRPFAMVSATLVQTLHGASTPAAIDGSSSARPAADQHAMGSYGTPQWDRVTRLDEAREKKQHEANADWLSAHLEGLADGSEQYALVTLAVHAHLNGEDPEAALTRLSEQYSDTVVTATREGWRRLWRQHCCKLPHEEQTRNTIDLLAIVGLAGLTLDIAAGLDLSSLTPIEARNAVRYASRGMNHFPAWLEFLANTQPAAVTEIFAECIVADYALEPEAPPPHAVLHLLSHAAPIVRERCWRIVADLITHGDPPRLDTLSDCVEVVIATSESHTTVTAVVPARCRAARSENARYALWWSLWLVLESASALDEIEMAVSDGSDGADALAVTICDTIWQFWEGSRIGFQFPTDASRLVRLTSIVFRHVRPDDDLQHLGVYILGARDHAQSLRNYLLNRLVATPGKVTYDGLRTLADVPTLASSRHMLLTLADQKLMRDMELSNIDIAERPVYSDRGYGLATTDHFEKAALTVPMPPRPVIDKHTILFLPANPLGADRLALDQEARAIELELERSGHRDRFEFVTRWVADSLDLLRELRRLRPTVVHFSGHGGHLVPSRYPSEGRPHSDSVASDSREREEPQHGLYFQGPEGQAQRVSAKALQDTFGAAGSSVPVVVLNACYSSAQAEALLAQVDCVVGMRSTIHDDAARSFAINFYAALGERESVAAAYRRACAAINSEGLPGTDWPHLAVRDGINAEQLVLTADRPPSAAEVSAKVDAFDDVARRGAGEPPIGASSRERVHSGAEHHTSSTSSSPPGLDQANTHRALGDRYLGTARLAEAEREYLAALDAFSVLEDQQGRANTQRALGDLYFRTNRLADAEHAYLAALEVFSTLHDLRGQANTRKPLGDLYRRTNRLADAERAYFAALDAFSALDDLRGQGNTRKVLGDLYRRTNRLADAERTYLAALDTFSAIDDRLSCANTRRALGDLYLRTNRLADAERAYLAVLDAFSALDDLRGQGNTRRALGDLYLRTDRLADAEHAYLTALGTFSAIDDRLGRANTRKALGDLYLRTDHLTDAEREYRAALDTFSTIDDRLGQANTRKVLGDLYLRTDRLTDAEREYRAALDAFFAIDDRLGQANARQSLGDLYLRTNRLTDAEREYLAALDAFFAIDDRLGQANARQSLGDLYRRTNRLADAEREYLAALDAFSAIDDRLGQANTRRALGDHYFRTNRLADAEREYLAALDAFSAINDRLGQANTRLAFGDLYLRTNRLADAEREYLAALDASSALDDRLGQADALSGLGQLAATREQFDDAFLYLRRAHNQHDVIDNALGVAAQLGYMARVAAAVGRTDRAIVLSARARRALRSIGDSYGAVLAGWDLVQSARRRNDASLIVPALLLTWHEASAIGDPRADPLGELIRTALSPSTLEGDLTPEQLADFEAQLAAAVEDIEQRLAAAGDDPLGPLSPSLLRPS